MINALNLSSRSDLLGIVASTLCFIHCLATPFLFVAHANYAVATETHPWWWGTLDLVFLLISFFAVYWSVKTTSEEWIKYAFWSFWAVLALIIANEKWEIAHLAEEAIYFPTLVLIFLHLLNRHYCKCEDDHCCADR